MFYQTLTFTVHGKIYKSYTKAINLKYQIIENRVTFKIDIFRTFNS